MEKITQRIKAGALLLMLWTGIGCVHAQNLLPNPSFEIQTGCPTAPGNFTIVGSWRILASHTGSPDYFHVCGNSTFGVPTNVFGSQLARTGSAYIGFVTHFGSGNFREYLQVTLPTTLTAGLSYTASAYLSLSDGSGWATDGFGFHFSTTSITGTGASTPIPFVPQVANPTGNYINSWVNWLPVTGSFVATAGLQYLTIGNFKTDAATGVQVQASGWSWNYTYLDDISVTPTVILSADMGPLSGVAEAAGARLDWHTLAERGTQRFEVERSIGDLMHFEQIGTVPASGGAAITTDYAFHDSGFMPAKLNYYRIKEVDHNGEGGYSETIALQTDALVNEVTMKAYPNPLAVGADLFAEISSSKEQSGQLDMVDLHGRVIHTFDLDLVPGVNALQISLGDLATGWYVARVRAGDLLAHQKIMVVQE